LVAFASYESDIAPHDENDSFDVFLRDLAAGTTTAISVDSNGAFSPTENGLYGTYATGISADGRFVLMEGVALALAPNESTSPYLMDVYIRDRILAMTTRQSNDPDGIGGVGASRGSRMSSDGHLVVFASLATNLIP